MIFSLGFVSALFVLFVAFLLVCKNTWKYNQMKKHMDTFKSLIRSLIRNNYFLKDKYIRFWHKVDAYKGRTSEEQVKFFNAHKDNWPYAVHLDYNTFFPSYYYKMRKLIRKPDADGYGTNNFFLWVCKDEEEGIALMQKLRQTVHIAFPDNLSMSRINEHLWDYFSELAKEQQPIAA
jgi:hypothetical protein